MSEFALTNRFKIPVPTLDNRAWLDYLTHWAEMMDVMFTTLASKDYIINGLTLSTGVNTLDFSYTAGSASVNNVTVNLSSGNGVIQPNTFNWIYVQSGQLKVSEYPPTGASFAPVGSLQTNDTGTIGHADLRVNGPIVNDVTITPRQVNPSQNINMAAGKRVLHTDANVGANTLMFSDAQIQSILNWGNQAAAIDWTELNVATFVSTGAKFAILNCYIATLAANENGWAILEVKTEDADTGIYNFVDYGHPSANALNASQRGHTNQIVLPLTSDKKFRVRTRISNLGLGSYSTFINLIGYIE